MARLIAGGGLLAALAAPNAEAKEKAKDKVADKKMLCADAYDQAQPLREAHRLLEARDQLRVCSQLSCPGFIVKDCTTWLVDVDARVPGLVFSAKDAYGESLANVSVEVDGKPLLVKLDGQSVEVDPGYHRFTFTASDGSAVEQAYVVVEGQKAQSVTATFAKAGAVVVAGDPPRARDAFKWTLQRKVATGTASAGVLGLGLGGLFAALTYSAVNAQAADCSSAKSCKSRVAAESDHRRASADGTIADIGFIAGGALIAAGAALFIFKVPLLQSKSDAASLLVQPVAGPTGASLFLQGEF